jgi:hypothetical protein
MRAGGEMKTVYVLLLRLLAKLLSHKIRVLVDVYSESDDGTVVTRTRLDLVRQTVISRVTFRKVAES